MLIPRFLAEFTQFPEWKQALSAEELEERVEATLERQCHSLYRHLKLATQLVEDLCSQDNVDRCAAASERVQRLTRSTGTR